MSRKGSLPKTQPVVLQRGRITKRSRHGIGRWLQRYWTLYTDGTLTYHDSEKGARKNEPRFTVNVASQCYDVRRGAEACDCAFPHRIPSENCFGLVTATRVFYLYTDASEDCRRWMENISRMAKNMISSNWNFTGMGTSTPQSHRGLKRDRPSSESSINDVGRDSGVFVVASARQSTVDSLGENNDKTGRESEKTATSNASGSKVTEESETKMLVTEETNIKRDDETRKAPAEDVVRPRTRKALSMSHVGKRDSVISATSRETDSDYDVLSDTEVFMRTQSSGAETFKIDTRPRKKSSGKQRDSSKKRFPRFGRRKSKEQPKKEDKVIRASTENTGAVGFIKYRDADGVVRFAQVTDEEMKRRQLLEEGEDTEDVIDQLEGEPDIPEEEEPAEEKLETEVKQQVIDQQELPKTQQPEVKTSNEEELNHVETELEKASKEEKLNHVETEMEKASKEEDVNVEHAAVNVEDEEVSAEEEEMIDETTDIDTVEMTEIDSDIKTSPVRKRTLKPADSWIRRQSALSRSFDDRKQVTVQVTNVKPAEEARKAAGSLVTQSPFIRKTPRVQGSPSKTISERSELLQIKEAVPFPLDDVDEKERKPTSGPKGGTTDKVQ